MRAVSIPLLAAMLLGSAAITLASPPACPGAAGCIVPLGISVSSGNGPNAVGLAGATVTIYQANEGPARALAAGTTGPDGRLDVTLPADDGRGIRYAVARRDKATEFATVIGASTPTAIRINELTTVATGYAMAQFLRKEQIAGKSLPLQVAAGMAENLVTAATGSVSPVMQASPNADETNALRSLGTLSNILAACVREAGTACEALFALADPPKGPKPTTTLSAVQAIALNPTANVRPLFELGNLVTVYEPHLEARHGPDSDDELMRLDGFTLAVKFNATGRISSDGREECPFGGPANIAFDRGGYAWITNNVVQGTSTSATCMVVLKPNGQAADGDGGTPDSPIFGGGILGQGFGIAIDPNGDVWAGNFGWSSDSLPIGSVSQFSPQGVPISPSTGYVSTLDRVQGTTSDQQGNIWMASYGNSAVVVFPDGDPDSGFPPYADGNSGPFHVVIDDDGFGWVSYSGSSTVSKFAYSPSGLVRQFTVPIGADARPKGLALDSRGNVWVAAGAESRVYALDRRGKVLGAFSGGGILGPWGLAVDSADNVWIANFGPDGQISTKYRVSRLCGARIDNCPPRSRLGDPISPDTGYTLPSGGNQVLLQSGEPLYSPLSPPSYKPLMRSTATHVDMAGNLWVTNNWKPSGLNDIALNPGGDGIVVFVGIAAPVKPTITGQPKPP